MRTLIDELLALAQTTRAELRHEPIDLSAMAAEIAAELQSGEPQRTARIAIERGLVAAGDARLVRSALANLLGNAWKYTAGVGAPQIEFGRVESGGTAEFYVRDNGSGFDVDAAGERLFRPFQRFHADSRYAGNGIGLAIVERVVARHGGRIRAESAPGAGASFFFTLEARGDGAPATEPRE
jgi:light-regulated signal transduction histidine kinase (bacteriophytochrome)